MINVDRHCVEPPKVGKSHRNKKVLNALAHVFLGKCYLCEEKQPCVGIFEIDHFKPTSKNPKLDTEWNNLYLCCKSCNSFKHKDAKEILDPCCDNVEKLIIYKYGYNPEKDSYIPVFLSTDLNNEKINNTVKLLENLHNREQGMSNYRAKSLRETIHKRWSLLMEACRNLDNAERDGDDLALQETLRDIKNYVSRNSPFTMLMRYTAKQCRVDKKIPDLFD